MSFKKEEVSQGEVEILPPKELLSELKDNLSEGAIDQLRIALNRSEDFTSHVVENRNIEEISPIITTLTDIFKKDDDGKPEVLEDKLGIWTDVIGTKGIIPSSMIAYNQRANLSAIITRLVKGVYLMEYEQDEKTGEVLKDDNDEPIVKKKTAINAGTLLRNYNNLCNLAINGQSRVLQAKVFGAWSGTSPIGMDSTWDNALTSLFGSRK